MGNQNVWKAVGEISRALFFCVVTCLLAEALFAVFVRAFAPSPSLITVINWVILALSIFIFAFLFIKRDRALFKGMAMGILAVIVTMIVFGCIGGFYLNAFFILQLLLGTVAGGGGAVLRANLIKE